MSVSLKKNWTNRSAAKRQSTGGTPPGSLNKSWQHAPDALTHGHVVYLVKFLGYTEVDQAKGTEVVKEGIRKIKFTNQIKKSEGIVSGKLPKVEFTISIDGVTVQDPKSKTIYHQYPLHRISYCADDKSDKKIFSFIAKEQDSEQHTCFVFVSDKCAEEITLTVGQAFDLAYRRFLDTSGRDLEMRKQTVLLQKRIQELEQENQTLKARVAELEGSSGGGAATQPTLLQISSQASPSSQSTSSNGPLDTQSLKLPPSSSLPASPQASPNRLLAGQQQPGGQQQQTVSQQQQPGGQQQPIHRVSTNPFDDDFVAPRVQAVQQQNGMPTLTPPPRTSKMARAAAQQQQSQQQQQQQPQQATAEPDLFGATPFGSTASPALTNGNGVSGGAPSSPGNPFRQSASPRSFSHNNGITTATTASTTANNSKSSASAELDAVLGSLDQQLSDIKDGFERGLSFGNDDFSLEDLDPLNSSSASSAK